MCFKLKFGNRTSLGLFTSSFTISFIPASLMHHLAMTSHSRHSWIFGDLWQYILPPSLCSMPRATYPALVVCGANISMLSPRGGRAMHDTTVYLLTPTPLPRVCAASMLPEFICSSPSRPVGNCTLVHSFTGTPVLVTNLTRKRACGK